MTEQQFKKVIQVVCIAAVTVFFIMALILIVLFSKQGVARRNETNLHRALEEADKKIESLQEQIERNKSDAYVELYAREQLGMIKKGEIKFIVK
jgi:cell division protein FtsB